MFTTNFDSFACEGDSIECERKGFRYVARIERDIDYRIDDDDCHNPDQSVTGCDDEQFQRLLEARAAWFNDEWFYCGVVIDVYAGDVCIIEHAASLWGIECNYPQGDNKYLRDVANELLDEAESEADTKRGELLEILESA